MGVPPPIPPGAGAADRRRVGSRSRSACPVGSCRSCARCCRSDRRSTVSILETVHFVHSSAHSSQSTGYYKQIKRLVVLVVCQLLDRFTTASRPLHDRFTTASRVRAALCSLSVQLPSTVHRHFTGMGSGCSLCTFFARSLLLSKIRHLIAFLPLSMGSPTVRAKSVSFFIHLSTVYRLFEIIFQKISFFSRAL